MKKFIVVLSMITCLFGMTACGEVNYTATEQYKMDNAIDFAEYYVAPYFLELTDNPLLNTADYTNDELADTFKSYVEANKEGSEVYEQLVAAAAQNGMAVEEFVNALYMYSQGSEDYSQYLAYDFASTSSEAETTGSIIKSGFASFKSGFETTGKLTRANLGTASARIDGETIIVSIPVVNANKDAEMEIIVSNDKFLKLESVALNVKYTFGETMAKAGENTLVGICTVFVMLILISFIISLFGYIPKIQESFAKKKESPKAEAIEKAVAQIEKSEEVAVSEDLSDDLELVAVIAAAIAAYEGSASTDGFVVRSIRKVNRR